PSPPAPALDALSLHDALPIYRSSITLEVPEVFRAPGATAARSKKLRALSGNSSMVRLSMTVPSTAVLVCNCGVVSPTSTVANQQDRKSTRLNSSHEWISYAVF